MVFRFNSWSFELLEEKNITRIIRLRNLINKKTEVIIFYCRNLLTNKIYNNWSGIHLDSGMKLSSDEYYELKILYLNLRYQLNNSPWFKFQVFIDGSHIEILRCGENGIYSIVIECFGDHFLFIYILFRDSFVIYASKIFCRCFNHFLQRGIFKKYNYKYMWGCQFSQIIQLPFHTWQGFKIRK